MLLSVKRRPALAAAVLSGAAEEEVVITAARLVILLRIAVMKTAVSVKRLVTVVVSLVTWLGIAFRNPAAAVNVEEPPVVVEVGATLAVKLVTLLGIAFRKEPAVNVEAAAVVVVLVTRVVESDTWLEIVRRRDSLELVTSVGVLVTWLVIVTGEEVVEEAVETQVEVVESVTSVVKEVTLRGNVLLLDLLSNQQKDGDGFE